MRVVIATVAVPFVRGGAEILAEGLHAALLAAGHEAEIVAVPFRWYPPERVVEHMLACRLLDLGAVPDRVIGLKFPAYLMPAPSKVLWLLHQHRQAYELWLHELSDLTSSPIGPHIRDVISRADSQFIPETRGVYTISQNVSRRLRRFNAIDSMPLYHPPQNAEAFHCGEAEDYLFFPSRLNPTKRQSLVLEALARTRRPVRVRFGGVADSPAYGEELFAQSRSLGLADRVEWIGRMTENQKLRFYAEALGVVFPPLDEDYGYVTLEAMLSAKPLITCSDSGGTLEFVMPGETGLVVAPTPEGLAAAMDRVWDDRAEAQSWGAAGRAHYLDLDISWDNVVARLLS